MKKVIKDDPSCDTPNEFSIFQNKKNVEKFVKNSLNTI
jgi:hypothetical protein